MNKMKQCFITLFFTLLTTYVTWSGDDKKELEITMPGEEIYVNVNKIEKQNEQEKDSKKYTQCTFDQKDPAYQEYVKKMTTEEMGEYLNKNFDDMAQKIKPTCPIPYNIIIDAKHSFLFGGPVGLGVYVVSKSIVEGLKKVGLCKKSEIKTVKKKYKEIHKKGFDTITGGYRTKAEVKNISFSQKTTREHLATGLFWLLKRLYVSGAVLGTTWLLNKYIIPQSLKNKLAWYDFKMTDPVFRFIARFNLWRLAYNPITR